MASNNDFKEEGALSPADLHDLETAPPLENPQKSFWERTWPTIACGAGLFSDGYLQSVIGPVNTVRRTILPSQDWR